jgi:four helix bundle protein
MRAVSDQLSAISFFRGATVSVRNFRDIKAWQKGHELALQAYRFTASFPDSERYGLTSQIRRAAISVPANIAEGCGRNSEADFARFLHIAMGSASELEYLLLVSRDLGFVAANTHNDFERNVVEVKRMLTGFVQKLKADS